MFNRVTAVLLFSLTLITSGCGASSMKTPDIKQNPNPKMRYEITMTIDGAPGPFDAISGFVQYKVANDQCVPLTEGSGATLAPEKSVPINLTRISDTVYKGTFYTDLLQDEDYYGRGVCHWAVVAATTALKVGKVGFSPDIFLDDIVAQKSITNYFPQLDYDAARRGDEDMFPVNVGESSPSNFKPDIQAHLFSVTLASKENFQ